MTTVAMTIVASSALRTLQPRPSSVRAFERT